MTERSLSCCDKLTTTRLGDGYPRGEHRQTDGH